MKNTNIMYANEYNKISGKCVMKYIRISTKYSAISPIKSVRVSSICSKSAVPNEINQIIEASTTLKTTINTCTSKGIPNSNNQAKNGIKTDS